MQCEIGVAASAPRLNERLLLAAIAMTSDASMSLYARTALQYSSPKPAIAAHLGLVALTVLPLLIHVPSSVNVVLTASLAVYAGCWRSIKPLPPTDAMSKGEAMRFPLVGSAVLFSLFLLFKFLPAVYVNMLLAGYLGAIAVVALTSAVTPYFRDLFPESLRDKEFVAPPFKVPGLLDATQDRLRATVPELFFGALSGAFCLWYYTTKFWVSNNVLGLVFCLEGIEHLSLGSTHVGTILLVGKHLLRAGMGLHGHGTGGEGCHALMHGLQGQ